MTRVLNKLRLSAARFKCDSSGGVTPEWIVAVSIVMLFSIPVVALVSSGSVNTIEPAVVRDADSLGDDYESIDELASAEDETGPSEEGPYYGPGTYMGVGFDDPPPQNDDMGTDTGLESGSGSSSGSTGGGGGGSSGGDTSTTSGGGGGGYIIVGGGTTTDEEEPEPDPVPEPQDRNDPVPTDQ